MCRSKKHPNSHRCPSHTEPVLIDQRNEVRREQYASKKLRDSTAEKLTESGISFVRGDKVENEYFQSNGTTYDIEKMEAIQDASYHDEQDEDLKELFKNNFSSKPEGGGLWTSPGRVSEDGGIKTEWTDWSHQEQFRVSNDPLVPLKVKKQAVIVHINSAEDLDALCKAFPASSPSFSYEAMAEAGIDGVRLSRDGLRVAKGAVPGEKMHNFSNWDIDSTVWINKDNIIPGKAVKKAFYERDDSRDDDYADYDEEENESWEEIEKQLFASSQQPIDFSGITPAQ